MVPYPEGKLINNSLNFKNKKAHFLKIVIQAKKTHNCPHCGSPKGHVKKLSHGMNRIIYTLSLQNEVHSSSIYESVKSNFLTVEEKKHVQKQQIKDKSKADLKIYEITPDSCWHIFKKLNFGDWCYLLQNTSAPLAENMVVSLFQVPPKILRPTINMSHEQTNEDDLTMKILELIRHSNLVVTNRKQGKDPAKINELKYLLQLLYNQLINSDSSESKSIKNSFAQVKGIMQRLKGKQGRFRGNLSGKRVEYTARTVISPDPNLQINEVAVPLQIAKELTFPEVANNSNWRRLQKCIINGPDSYPGANFVTFADLVERPVENQNNSSTERYFLGSNEFRRKVAMNLKMGDIVHRHLVNKDVVLFNRQPSLHKQSIMAFKAVVRDSPDKTLKFNECVCSPFNADFDGDEMNLHLLQNYLAKGEALGLMDSSRNLLTSKNGEATITLIQDFLTSLYVLTGKDFLMPRDRFCQLFISATNGNEKLNLPPPVIQKPVQLWTGKQLFSLLLNPNANRKLSLSVVLKEKFYDSSKNALAYDLDDGLVVLNKGELVCGRIGKNAMGGSKSSLFFALIRSVGSSLAAKSLHRFAVLSSKVIEFFGISFGLRDVLNTREIEKFNSKLFAEKIEQTRKVVDSYLEDKRLKNEVKTQKKNSQGRSVSAEDDQRVEDDREERAKLEIDITGLLNAARDEAGKFLTGHLHHSNNALIMALCGAKGSVLNICQMASTLGQQTVSGSRIQNAFLGRTLPHFNVNDFEPKARGFIANSFFTGLKATEFFFHTMAGREGLIDTAVKTADTGYMQRKLMKVLEDLVVEYDFTVRNSEKKLIQFSFGDDAFDPKDIESDDFPIRLQSSFRLLKDFKPEKMDASKMKETILEINDKFLRSQARESHFKKEQVADDVLIDAKNQNLVHQIFENDFEDVFVKTYPIYQKNLKFTIVMKQIVSHLVQKCKVKPIKVGRIRSLFKRMILKIMRTIVNPGEAVGAIAATSLGEPCTQMTLKTFHFAGVASMNVTLGVPRIKEIFNASEEIATPIIEIALRNSKDPVLGNFVKNQINAVYLSDILWSIEEVYDRSEMYLLLRFDFEVISSALIDVC
jgi:DNA-directed RNA polymerase III subunit RPC1